MKKTIRMIGMALVAVLLSVNFAACSDDDDDEGGGSIVGTWRLTLTDDSETWYCQYNFKSDGTLQVKDWSSESGEPSSYEAEGRWSVDGDILTITVVDGDGGWSESYRFSVSGKKLIIYDYEEDGPNTFVRV